MQTLTYKELEELGDTTKEYEIPSDVTGIDIGVFDGKGNVVLVVGKEDVCLSVEGARDLALALRQSANRIEKLNRS